MLLAIEVDRGQGDRDAGAIVQDAAQQHQLPGNRPHDRSLQQFLELVEFYGTHPIRADGAKPEEDLRAQAVAAVSRALTLRAYHVPQAHELIERLQPPLAVTRRRRSP